MAHKSAVSMSLSRARLAIVFFLCHPQNAANATLQRLGSSIGEQTSIGKVVDRANGFDCDVAHCATYYSVIFKRYLVVLWYLIPKIDIIGNVIRAAHIADPMIRIDFVGRSRA